MHVLAFAASLREGSLNRKLVQLAARIAEGQGHDVEVASFGDFDGPSYDGDLDVDQGLPPGPRRLVDRLRVTDALLIALPEYNYSVPGGFKNLVDWTSRARPMPWRGRSIYLMSASPSPIGGIRGLWHARVPLEGCGAFVFPDMFALAFADRMFDERGDITDKALGERLRTELIGYLRLADATAGICGRGVGADGKARRKEIAKALEDETIIQPQ